MSPAESGMTMLTAFNLDIPETLSNKISNLWLREITDIGYTWYRTFLSADQTYIFKKSEVDITVYDTTLQPQVIGDASASTFSFTPTTSGTYFFKVLGLQGEVWELIHE